jgi:hypothetical protein
LIAYLQGLQVGATSSEVGSDKRFYSFTDCKVKDRDSRLTKAKDQSAKCRIHEILDCFGWATKDQKALL